LALRAGFFFAGAFFAVFLAFFTIAALLAIITMAVVEQCSRESRAPHPDYYRTRKKTRFHLNELFTRRLRTPRTNARRETSHAAARVAAICTRAQSNKYKIAEICMKWALLACRPFVTRSATRSKLHIFARGTPLSQGVAHGKMRLKFFFAQLRKFVPRRVESDVNRANHRQPIRFRRLRARVRKGLKREFAARQHVSRASANARCADDPLTSRAFA
jgi:hypothetical protein